MSTPHDDLPVEYVRAGLALISIPRGAKGPRARGWQLDANAIHTEKEAARLNGDNIGLAHRWCGTCAVDVDDYQEALPWLEQRGIDLQSLLLADDAVQIISGMPNRAKLLYRLPDGLEWLPTHKLDGLELRCASRDGTTTVQDILPPSIHPDTGKPYKWGGAGDWRRIPALPGALLTFWRELTGVGSQQGPHLGIEHDPVLEALDERGMVLGPLHGKPGGWSVRCPWESAHTGEGGNADTAYFEPHTNGYAGSAFNCLHSHCINRGILDLRIWLGIEKPSGLSGGEGWPEPQPLPEGLPPVPDLDPVLLPETLRGWCEDIADRIQCPIDYPAIGAMVALAAVVGRQVGIRPRRRDDWTVISNLWGAIVGRPGLLKTPALTEVMRPMYRLEVRAREEYAAAMLAHEADRIVGKADAKETEKAIAAAIRKKDRNLANALATRAVTDETEKPVRRRYVTSDTTIEKLGELLAANPRGVLVYRDELTGWLRELDREGREGSRAFYLEAWNGTGRYTYDRIGRGTIDIEAACVSILGGIQPGPLSEYMRGAIDGGAGDDGLLQRIQIVAWPDPPRDWLDVDRWPDTDARRTAWDVFERLDLIEPAAIGAQREDDGIPWLRLDDDAAELFRDWRAELEGRLRAGAEHPAFEAALAKYRSLVPSIALLVHLADHHEAGPVGERAMVVAIAWARYLEAHARRLYSPALDPALNAARELARHIRAGDLQTPFQSRDVYRNCWRLLDRRGTEDALEYLSDLAWLRAEDVNTGGRPRRNWHLNPAVRG